MIHCVRESDTVQSAVILMSHNQEYFMLNTNISFKSCDDILVNAHMRDRNLLYFTYYDSISPYRYTHSYALVEMVKKAKTGGNKGLDAILFKFFSKQIDQERVF